MIFEQALRAELISISGMTNKVFPMNAPEGTATPFVIYSKTETELIKTLSGTSNTRIGRYDLDIISETYSSLQDAFVLIKNKLISFEGRTIGTGGPFVQSVIIDNFAEVYEYQPQFYRMNVEVKFYYEGV